MQRLLFPALVSALGIGLALPASASLTYRMVAATCTDSNAKEVLFPDGEGGTIGGAGPKVCANHITVEVTMRGDYVPGTQFNWSAEDPTPPPVENFFYDDGALRIGVDSSFNRNPLSESGMLPARGVQRTLFGTGNNGGGFGTNPDGTWSMNVDSIATIPGAICGIASTEGPNGCIGASNYNAIGTYRGWQRVPEPATSVLLLTSVGLMGLMSRRRKGRQPETFAT
jgi:hypothetical protein